MLEDVGAGGLELEGQMFLTAAVHQPATKKQPWHKADHEAGNAVFHNTRLDHDALKSRDPFDRPG